MSGAAESGGAAQPHGSGCSNKRRCHHNTEPQSKRLKEQIDYCEVYVSNLPETATEDMLRKKLSYYARVEEVTIKKYKKSNKSKGSAIVKVRNFQDVQRLLVLREELRNIQEQTFTIRGARNRVKVPGDDGYVRLPLSDRDFDLASPDPEQPSIHMLVDDVILKVFSYLPLKCLLACERVCRRWQLLLHQYFSKKTNLKLSEARLGIPYPRTETVIPKLLILAGPNLRSLKIHKVKFWGRWNILQIIGQLCPQLEYLDVSKSLGIDFTYVEALAEGCKNMKGFVARDCLDFSKSVLHRLLNLFPKLEKLDVLDTMTHLKDYKILPSTLKELHIDAYLDYPDEMTIPMIADRCPNLEGLTLMDWETSAVSLMYIGNTCHKLTKLSVDLDLDKDDGDNYTQALSAFKQLKELAVFAATLDLKLLFKSLSQLEVLTLRDIYASRHVDFSILKKLKSLTIKDTQLTEASLKTVAKCREIETIHISSLSQEEMVVDFLQGCPKLKEIFFPKIELSRPLITKVDKAMKGRPGKVVIKMRDKNCLVKLAQYDTDKIQFGCPPKWMENLDSEISSSENDALYDIF